jgi:NAD(P)H dehydrogenase (quinone)
VILVTGATGTIGRFVVSGLIEAGTEFRATTRQDALPGSAPFLVRMDLEDRDSVEAALRGVDVAFLNSSQHPRMASHQSGLIDAAAEAGVRHVVKVSAGSAATGPDKPSWVGRAHAAIERRLERSGMEWTILRPNYFMQNLLGLAPAISAGALPMALDEHRLAPVDARDIAAVATAVLGDPLPHRARTYELTGPESLTPADIADRLSAGVGRRVTHVPLTLEVLRSSAAAAGAPEWIQQHVVELMDLYAGDESVGVVSKDVERVTGQAPGTLAGFVEDHASTFGRAV